MANNTTRYPNGVTNSAPNSGAMSTVVIPNQGKTHSFFDDFNTFTAANWTVTRSSTTAAVLAVADADNGILTVTPAVTDNANTFVQSGAELFTFTQGKETWYESRWKISEATQSDVIFGLIVRDTSPLANTSGVYFIKDDDAATINFISRSSSSQITTSTAVATISSSTYVRTGFYYDGGVTISAYVDDARVAIQTIDTMPTTELAVTFGVQNGSTNAKTLSVDYINVVKER